MERKMKFFPATRIEFAIWPLAPEIDLGRHVGAIWRSWMRRLAIRHLRRELNSLPDWLLYDVGINRGEIGWLATQIVDGHDVRRRSRELPKPQEQRP
jgi:uncharacterized protein YjiS (DUF1127 family)